MFQNEYDQDFTRNFLISLGAHVVIVALAFFGGKLMMRIFKNNDVEIIRASVRVDVVGMPKFTVQELKEMQKDALPPEPEVKAEGSKVETKTEDKTEDVIKKDDLIIQESGKVEKKSSFLNVLSDYSNKKIAKKEKNKGDVTGAGDKNINNLVLEGNRLSKGSALVGDLSEEGSSEFAAYVQTLPETIRQFWKLPSYLLEKKDLRCRIKIFLSSTGNLVKLELLESSGEKEFDARAEKAIRDAAPFPKPSEEIGARLTSSGIILGFPL